MLHLEKVPFDVVEAESELIDGVTTEFGGYAFSLVYAAEAVTAFLLLKVYLLNAGFVLLPLMLAILGSYYGRMFLPRILISDLIETACAAGLVVSVVLLAVVVSLRVGKKRQTFLNLSRWETLP